jgi:hypothetical protein
VLPCPVCRARGVGTDDGSNVHFGAALHRAREYPLIPRGAVDHDFPDVCIPCWCDEGHEFEISLTVRRGTMNLIATWVEGDDEEEKEMRAQRRLAHAMAAVGPQEPRSDSDAFRSAPREPRKEESPVREVRPEREARMLMPDAQPVMRNPNP